MDLLKKNANANYYKVLVKAIAQFNDSLYLAIA